MAGHPAGRARRDQPRGNRHVLVPGQPARHRLAADAGRQYRRDADRQNAGHYLLPPVRLLPDPPPRYRVYGPPATHVRLKIFPDGGVARLRLYGSLTETGLAAMRRRWDDTA